MPENPHPLRVEDILNHVRQPLHPSELTDAQRAELSNPIHQTVHLQAALRWFQRYKSSTEPLKPEDRQDPLGGGVFKDLTHRSFFEDPREGEANFVATAREELMHRFAQDVRFNRLHDHVPRAHTAEDMVTLALSYIKLHGESRAGGSYGPQPFSHMVRAMLRRAGQVHMDPVDGWARPDDLMRIVVPALMTYVVDQQIAKAAEPTGLTPGTQVGRELPDLMPAGSAEHVAGVRLKEHLAASKLPNTRLARGSGHRDGQKLMGGEYLTVPAIQHVQASIAVNEEDPGLPVGHSAQEEAVRLIQRTMESLAHITPTPHGRRVAVRLVEMLHQRSRDVRQPHAAPALGAADVLSIGNAATRALNTARLGLSLETLDEHAGAGQLNWAFRRMLRAVDANHLAEAEYGSLFDDQVGQLRLRTVYLDALAGQWRDYGEGPAPNPMLIGDIAMVLSAVGFSPKATKSMLEQATSSGRPRSAAAAYRTVMRTPDVRRATGRELAA